MNRAALGSCSSVVPPAILRAVEAGGADEQVPSTAALTERELLLTGVRVAPALPVRVRPPGASGEGHGRSRSVSTAVLTPAPTEPSPGTAALAALAHAKRAWLRYERRTPVQLELAP